MSYVCQSLEFYVNLCEKTLLFLKSYEKLAVSVYEGICNIHNINWKYKLIYRQILTHFTNANDT